jgi:L,D-peptidoglycan transpeptidase YkuD (ErfK/YbiS/YcfS/YnhG family)
MPRRTRRIVVGASAVIAVTAVGTGVAVERSLSERRRGVVPCDHGPRHVVVDTARHRLAVCEGGRAIFGTDVRLGRGGVDKTREGDRKTPRGRYPFGPARASTRFGIFVPIGYPTDAQRALGLTGSAVGVHGPPRALRWLGRFVNAFDSTDGCVGIATDAEMSTFAASLPDEEISIEIR